MPKELRDAYLLEFKRYYSKTLGLRAWEPAAAKRLNLEVAKSHLQRLSQVLCELTGPILDLGSGPGDLSIAFGLEGQEVLGVEPSQRWVKLSQSWSRFLGLAVEFVSCEGEYLPLQSDYFGLVCTNYVLEHVRSPWLVLQEVRRILKTGGYCYLNAPNYLFPFEPHYSVPWIPKLPKKIGEKYLKLLGRDPEFLWHLNYLTSLGLKSLIARSGFSILRDYILEYLQNPERIQNRTLEQFVRLLRPLSHLPALVTLFSPDFSVLLKKQPSERETRLLAETPQ